MKKLYSIVILCLLISIIFSYVNISMIENKTGFGVFISFYYFQIPIIASQLILTFLLIFGIVTNKRRSIKYFVVSSILVLLITLINTFSL
jgi:hypothetical protein